MALRENRVTAACRFAGYLRLMNRVLERDFLGLGPGRCREDYSGAEREPSDAQLAALELELENSEPSGVESAPRRTREVG